MSELTLKSVSFSFEGQNRTLIDSLSTAFHEGWTGIIGANGCGKSTLLEILRGKIEPTMGTVLRAGISIAVYCPQDTVEPPDGFWEFLDSYEKGVISYKSKLGLHELCHRDWGQLSHGERKRFQLGCALSSLPDVLLVDEPTNHLDRENREFILSALKSYSGIGVIVSHDRVLLNGLCGRCLIHDGSSFKALSGSYDQAKSALDEQRSAAANRMANLENQGQQLNEEVRRLDQIDSRSAKRLSKGHVAAGDRDAKTKIDRARLSGKDASGGKKKHQLQARIEEIKKEKRSLQGTKDYSDSIFFSRLDRKKRVLLNLKAGAIPLPDGTRLAIPDLIVESGDKIGLVGPNGAGKSSLLQYLSDHKFYRTETLLYLDQELNQPKIDAVNQALDLLKKNDYGRCLQIFARLGSDAKRVFQSPHRSPGEVRKLAIALAIVQERDLLILDEPTNHLDLPSIEKLGNALAMCSIALILVSHDRAFIESTCHKLWRLERQSDGTSRLEVD